MQVKIYRKNRKWFVEVRTGFAIHIFNHEKLELALSRCAASEVGRILGKKFTPGMPSAGLPGWKCFVFGMGAGFFLTVECARIFGVAAIGLVR